MFSDRISERLRTYSCQFDGNMATTTANIHNCASEICPRIIVSELDDIVYHFNNGYCFSLVSSGKSKQKKSALTFCPASHCFRKATGVFWILFIVFKDRSSKALVKWAVYTISLKGIRLDSNA